MIKKYANVNVGVHVVLNYSRERTGSSRLAGVFRTRADHSESTVLSQNFNAIWVKMSL